MKKLKNIYIILFSLMTVLYGCQENEHEFGEIVSPTDIVITAEVVGADADNPYGDGKASKRIVDFIKNK